MDLKIGDRVLVHQEAGVRIADDGIERIPHDCSDPKSHWASRIMGWNDIHQCWNIATPAEKNPNHAEWPYPKESLTLLGGEDWVEKSAFHPGIMIEFTLLEDDFPHYPDGTVLEAKIEAAHIESGDWYVSFPIPYEDWRFKRVVNERDMRRIRREGRQP